MYVVMRPKWDLGMSEGKVVLLQYHDDGAWNGVVVVVSIPAGARDGTVWRPEFQNKIDGTVELAASRRLLTTTFTVRNHHRSTLHYFQVKVVSAESEGCGALCGGW